MKKLLLPVLIFSLISGLSACSDGQEETTKEEVLEEFDENSQRPAGEEEYQEDSAVVTGTPIETE